MIQRQEYSVGLMLFECLLTDSKDTRTFIIKYLPNQFYLKAGGWFRHLNKLPW